MHNSKKYMKKYRQRPEVKKRHIIHLKRWRDKVRNNQEYKLNHSMRANMCHSLKGTKDGGHWETLVGYSLNDLKKHLGIRFSNEMTWENYGSYWSIDHRIPISWFSYKTPQDAGFKICWSLDNLQPMKITSNSKKGNRYAQSISVDPSLLYDMIFKEGKNDESN